MNPKRDAWYRELERAGHVTLSLFSEMDTREIKCLTDKPNGYQRDSVDLIGQLLAAMDEEDDKS